MVAMMCHGAGPNDHTIAQIKDAVRDGLRAVKNTIEDESVVLVRLLVWSISYFDACIIQFFLCDRLEMNFLVHVQGAGAFEVAARQYLINDVKKTVQGVI